MTYSKEGLDLTKSLERHKEMRHAPLKPLFIAYGLAAMPIILLLGVGVTGGYKLGQHHPNVKIERRIQDVYLIVDDPRMVFYAQDGINGIALVDRKGNILETLQSYDGKPCVISESEMKDCRLSGGFHGEVEGKVRKGEK